MLTGSTWWAKVDIPACRYSVPPLVLCYSIAEYCCPVFSRSSYTTRLTLNYTVTCGLFHDVCVPHKPSCFTKLASEVSRGQDVVQNREPWRPPSSCWCFQSPTSTSTTFITTSNLVRFDTCGHEHTVEKGLAINFGNQSCHTGGSHHPSARLWSSSLFVVLVEPLPHRAGSLQSPLYRWWLTQSQNCLYGNW